MGLCTDEKIRSTRFQRGFLPALFLAVGIVTVLVVRVAMGGLPSRTLDMLRAWQYAILGLIVGGLVIASLKRLASRMWWEAILTITIFLGVWYVLLLVRLPLGASLIVVSILTLAHLFLRVVGMHNLFYVLGGVGVAINFASLLPDEVLIIGLVGFTVYDMVAGPPGGPIQALATTLMRYGIVPGFILPAKVNDLLMGVDATVLSRAILLGAGDVILPMSLVARAALRGTMEGAIVLLGAVLGSLVLSSRRDLHPRAALVPLAVGTIIPFFIISLNLLRV